MSSDRPPGVPSPEPARPEEAELELADLLRLRGAALLEALERHLPGARDHAGGTASYAFVAAVGMGFERRRCEVAREVARLHEVGLIYVPVAIAAKPRDERDAAEHAAWASHYEAGSRLGRGAGLPEHVCSWLLRARERYDGGGPEALAGDRIPVESRLIRAACVCQTALTRSGDGQRQTPAAAAAEALAAGAGTELDPRVAAALAPVLERAGRQAHP